MPSESRPCPPCKYPNPCYCDQAVRLQEEFEGRGSKHPFVRQMSCRRCHGMRRFVIERVREDRRGVRWGYYRDADGHEDYVSLTVQDYATLRSRQ